MAALVVASCARPEHMLYPVHDPEGRPVKPDPNSCLASVAARRYIYEMREKVLAEWQPPAANPGRASVVFFLRIAESGELKQVYTESPDDPVQASALVAFRRAAPFPAVPAEAACLAEEPFQATFTLEVR